MSNLTTKHRLSMQNERSDDEVWYMHISPLNIIVGLLTFILVLFIAIFSTVTYTPILDFAPGYPGSKSREMIIENILQIDSLEQQISNLEAYNVNMALIMSGKSPVTREILQNDSIVSRSEFVFPSLEDSLLRLQMESDGIYSLNDANSARKSLRTAMDSYPPVSGVVLSHFSPKDYRFGVGIAVPPGSEVLAVMQGTVIASEWTPKYGTVIYIQHSDDMISIYRNNISGRVKMGDRVEAGAVIAYIIDENNPNNDEQLLSDNKQIVEQLVRQIETESNRFEFELWRKGSPVDPENFIVF